MIRNSSGIHGLWLFVPCEMCILPVLSNYSVIFNHNRNFSVNILRFWSVIYASLSGPFSFFIALKATLVVAPPDEMDDLTQADEASETESLLERDLVSPKLLDRSITSPNMLRSPNLLDRSTASPNMLSAHPAASTTNLFVRWSIEDWSTAVLIFASWC